MGPGNKVVRFSLLGHCCRMPSQCHYDSRCRSILNSRCGWRLGRARVHGARGRGWQAGPPGGEKPVGLSSLHRRGDERERARPRGWRKGRTRTAECNRRRVTLNQSSKIRKYACSASAVPVRAIASHLSPDRRGRTDGADCTVAAATSCPVNQQQSRKGQVGRRWEVVGKRYVFVAMPPADPEMKVIATTSLLSRGYHLLSWDLN